MPAEIFYLPSLIIYYALYTLCYYHWENKSCVCLLHLYKNFLCQSWEFNKWVKFAGLNTEWSENHKSKIWRAEVAFRWIHLYISYFSCEKNGVISITRHKYIFQRTPYFVILELQAYVNKFRAPFVFQKKVIAVLWNIIAFFF